MRVLNNIDVFQINIEGSSQEYYFPQNVSWADKKINRIVVVGSTSQEGQTSPIDGQTPLLSVANLRNMYVDLVGKNDLEIARNLSVEQIIFFNNHIVNVNAVLALQLCRFTFSSAPEYGCFLVYVIYEESEKELLLSESVTIQFPLSASADITIKEIIDEYMHAKTERVTAVVAWNAEETPFYLTLRDEKDTFVFNSVHSCLMRSQTNNGDPSNSQIYPLALNFKDVDMDNSFVRNATNKDITITLTFFYS